MSKASNASFVEISLFVHATEDLDKVMESLENVIGDRFGNLSFHRENLQGHYGNPIMLLKAESREEHLIREITNTLVEGIKDSDTSFSLSGSDRYTNGRGVSYLRLDKQAAYLGRIASGRADPIHIKFRIRREGNSV